MELATQTQWESREMVETLKATVCKGATDAQFKMFIEVCKATGLNPFLKEIWYVPNVGVMAGRDGYLRIANEHPQFDGIETTVERDDKGIPIKATCRVWRKDRQHPTSCEAFYDEYKKDSQVWRTYKSAMISKVAEVLALKRSFSINGMVTEEEIGEQEPHGSREAQIQVRDAKLAAIPRQIEAPLDIEQRHRAQQAEAQAVIDESKADPKPKPKRGKGDISYKALGEIQVLKKELKALTGDDALYYEALYAAGVKHADELAHVSAKPVWKALADIRLHLINAAKEEAQNKERHESFAKEWERLGNDKFIAGIGICGYTSLDELLGNASVEQEDAALRHLRSL